MPGDLPDAPLPEKVTNDRKNRLFKVEAIAGGLANAADAATTKWGIERGLTEARFPRGMAELLGSRPGIGRYSALFVPAEIGETLLARKLEKSPHKSVRLLGHVLMDAPTVAHAWGAIRNATIPSPKKR